MCSVIGSFLDRHPEHVSQFAVEPIRRDPKVVPRPDQLSTNPYTLPNAQNRTLDVIGMEIVCRFMDTSRFVLESE